MIKYLQQKRDKHNAIHEVDFKKMTYKLVSCLDGKTPDIKGKFKKGGFSSTAGFVQVPKPV